MTNFNRYAECCVVALAIAEREYRSREWIELQRLLHQHHEAVDAGSEIDRISVQVDPQFGVQPKH